MLDERVAHIADSAAEGRAPSCDDVVHLLKFDAYSPEAGYVCAVARRIGMRACGGRGRVYAQIGVDQHACPENCVFCSFAAVNTDPSAYDPASVEVPIGRIVHYAKLFDGEKVDLISLMCTAGLPFDRYLDMVRAVRASVSDDMVIMANASDLTPEQAQALAQAGVGAAYHALRLGEGELTDVEPIERKRTIRHLHAAGIPLMTGVEPVWQDADLLLLAQRICEIPEFEPFCMGSCGLTAVEGVDTGGRKPPLVGFVRYVAAITRLVCGESVPVGGIGGVAWIDAGCDPRSRNYGEDDATLRRKIADARRRLACEGFSL